jgi:uncharacterized protein
LVAVGGVFLLAGTVKGVIGLGLPTVCLGLLILITDLPGAMALMLVPSFVTNVWQGCVGGSLLLLLRRLWPFLVPATLLVFLGGLALTDVDLTLLSALLGLLLVAYASLGLAGIKLQLEPPKERWAGPLFGAVNGLFTGLTGSFVVPGVMFLQAIGLSRDQLVQAMGITFTGSTVALALSLGGNDLLNKELGLISLAGVIPALLGMMLGQKIRKVLSEVVFRKVFFGALFVLGGYIVVRAVI